jgi:kynurenine formamidase
MNWKRALLRTSLMVVLLAILIAGGGPPAFGAQNGSLAEAYKIISSKRFVDLTHSFGPTTPVWKGFGQATFSAAEDPETGQPYSIAKDGFRASVYSMVGQYGTHVDAPAHFDPQGIGVGEIPLKQMMLPLVVFDMTPMLGDDPNHALTVADIQKWEHQYGRVPAGSFAALRTDMYKDWEASGALQTLSFPGLVFGGDQVHI